MKKLLGIALPALAFAANTHAQAIDDAAFVSVQYPADMEAGRSYPVKLTFTNTGMSTWTTGTPESLLLYRAGAIGDSLTWGVNRANMTSSSTVSPGASYTFSFKVTAPANPGGTGVSYPFQWGMLHERVRWFGQVTPTTPPSQQITVRNAPPMTASSLPTITPDVAPVVPVMSDFTFANFRGANVLNQTFAETAGQAVDSVTGYPIGNHLNWIPDTAQLSSLLATAKSMNLNVLRFTVVIPPSTDYDASQWGGVSSATATANVIAKVQNFLTIAQDKGFKVIITLDGYTKYGYSGEVSRCYWKRSFNDVQANAALLIAAVKDKPALYAWDVLNEPLHNAAARFGKDTKSCLESAPGVADPDAYKSVVNAVHAMYNLIKRYDKVHLTTVGEGNGAYVRYWQDISSFVSYHQYYNFAPGNTAPSAADYALVKNIVIGTYNNIPSYWGDRPWPVVVTEYGIANDQSHPQIQYDYYKNFLLSLKGVNAGGMLWSLSATNALRMNNSPAMTCLVAGIQTNDNPSCPTP